MGNCCVRVKLARNKMTQRKRRRKIILLLVGLDEAGKTTAAKGLVGESTKGTVPTVGFSTFTHSYKGFSVTIYDLGGGPQIRGIWNKYFIDVHGIIYVVDASDTSRIDESRLVLQELLTHEKLAGKPLLLLANKQDCEGALDEIDVVEQLKLESIVNQQRCPTLVETCSALADKDVSNRPQLDPGIQNGYRWLLSIIIKEFKHINARVEADTQMAKIQWEIEKRDRKSRVEEQRREREELEGTIIIPLKDDSLEDGKIIQVKTLSVESEDPSMGTECTDGKINQLSDSHDSGYTVQNVEDYEEVGSSVSVLSQDSAVQSVSVQEKEKQDGGNVTTFSSPTSYEIVEKSKANLAKPPKFLRFNKTAPAPTGVFLQENHDSHIIISAHHRQKLPPLTPPVCRTKLFEAKSGEPGRLLKSLSLSSDDSDERLSTSKSPFTNRSNIAFEGILDNHNLNGLTNNIIEADKVIVSYKDQNRNNPHSEVEVGAIAETNKVQSNIFDAFTIKATNSS